MTVALSDYLVVSALLFGVGIYGLMTKRNAMRLVFSVEILVNAANINFIAFNRYPLDRQPSGRRPFSSQSHWRPPRPP